MWRDIGRFIIFEDASYLIKLGEFFLFLWKLPPCLGFYIPNSSPITFLKWLRKVTATEKKALKNGASGILGSAHLNLSQHL